MNKYLLTFVCFMAVTISVTAQSSMTDSQIISFIQKEQKSGTSQSQIATKLMQKGVSVQKLQQLRKKYQNMQQEGNTMGGMADDDNTSRMRTANGQSVRGGNTMDGDNAFGMHEEGFGSEEDMRDAIDGFMPDSMSMLEKKIELKLKSRKKVFGHDIFNNRNLSFEPNMNIATPQTYVLGPGDVVNVDVYGASQKTVTETISPDGTITIEDFGPVTLSGLTVSQAKARLRSTLGSRYVSSQIRLTVGQTKTIMVNVMGEVQAPGTYNLSAFATVFHALYMAGGTNDIGTLRDIKVYRNGKLVSSVDIYDYILNGKLTGNCRLADNDVILVGPYDCLVNVTGKVKRPMYYEMKNSESLETLLKYTGGFRGDAYTKSVRVVRKKGSEYGVFNVTADNAKSFRMFDEDSVSVDSVIPRYENMVELRGAAFRPGMYHLGGEITTVKGLITTADGLKENAMGNHAILHRMKADRTLEAVSLDIEKILNGQASDVQLRNEDVLFIPSNQDRHDEWVMKIFGEVQYPGTYKYAEGTTVEDLILQAGGLKNSASRIVKINRRSAGSDGDNTANARTSSFELTLKDGFSVEDNDAFKIQPFDEVYVNRNPEYANITNVSIEGEVMTEGTYGLSMTNTRVSDVLKMAGGLTAQAAPNGTYILRKMNDEEKRRRQMKVDNDRSSNAYKAATTQSAGMDNKLIFADSLLVEEKFRNDFYAVAVDLKASLEKPGSIDDLVLRDGDRIIVQELINTVRVTGSVPYENAITYVKGKNIKYYMAQGGMRGRKNRRWAYVIYQNGSARMVKDGAKAEPGCQIVFPERDTRSTAQQNASMWISIGSTIATMAAVVLTAIK